MLQLKEHRFEQATLLVNEDREGSRQTSLIGVVQGSGLSRS